LWTDVDRYITDLFIPDDPISDQVLMNCARAGLPSHNVAPNQGKLLMLLAMVRGAVSILEIGTLGGYSTIWLARALPPHGHLITLEADPNHVAVAQRNIAYAGLAERVDIRLGQALETLPQIAAEQAGPFDLI